MRTNRPVQARASATNYDRMTTPTNVEALRRAVLACMLFEDSYAKSGSAHAKHIEKLVEVVAYTDVAKIAVDARANYNLRHVPLFLGVLAVRKLSKDGNATQRYLAAKVVEDMIVKIIQRADEIAEFVALYEKVNGRRRGKKGAFANVMLRALRRVFESGRFDAYQFQKWDRRATAWRTRDVMFLVCPKPRDGAQAALFNAIANDTLPVADTWEVRVSAAGSDRDAKRAAFEELLAAGKLGYMALLRNLRLMTEVGVPASMIEAAIVNRQGAQRVLPFRFLSAFKVAPQFKDALDTAFCMSIDAMPTLPGKTAVLVDVSWSMNDPLSAKSEMRRMDAAATLACMVKGDHVDRFTFSAALMQVVVPRGLAGISEMNHSQAWKNTHLVDSVNYFTGRGYDRLIVITDEQDTGSSRPYGSGIHGKSWAELQAPGTTNYIINVGTDARGIAYKKGWMTLSGFSEHLLQYIAVLEAGGLFVTDEVIA